MKWEALVTHAISNMTTCCRHELTTTSPRAIKQVDQLIIIFSVLEEVLYVNIYKNQGLVCGWDCFH